ncbi:glucose-1-phosphate cytidylyltransferase [bacterium]|nr:glucose-1-phosphate cytidylyltransferase [bacterium]
MQVVILCGGMGTRIRDVADDIPKPMVPVGGKPILWHIMNGYARQGFKKFVLCLGYKSWVIKQYFLNYGLAGADLTVGLRPNGPVKVHPTGAADDWQVTLAETGAATMTGGRVHRVARYLDGDRFMLTYGDGLADIDLHALLAFHQQHGRTGTVTTVRPPGRFGEVEIDGPLVSEFAEKPLLSRGRISGGFFVFERRFLDRLPDDDGLVLEQEPLIQLARDGELAAYQHDGFWQCMDSSRDHQYLNQLWDAGGAPWDRTPPPLRIAA